MRIGVAGNVFWSWWYLLYLTPSLVARCAIPMRALYINHAESLVTNIKLDELPLVEHWSKPTLTLQYYTLHVICSITGRQWSGN